MSRLIVLAVLSACIGHAWPADTTLPPDVQAFMERRGNCDHWRGEEPYDAERRAEIDLNACQLCSGTDAQLEKLNRKYRTDPKVRAALSGFDAKVEQPSPRAMARTCKAAIGGGAARVRP